MKRKISASLSVMLLMLICLETNAQQSYTLQQAIDYALLNNESVINAELSRKDADAQVAETRADGLPQINANFGYVNNTQIPVNIVPANVFDPNAPEGETAAIRFGVQHQGNLNVSASQMIWDGSFFIGLKAAKTLRELVSRDKVKAEVDVVAGVTKAYYLVLINQSRIDLIDANYANLESTFKETQALYENGFAEKIDVSRLQVQLNNLAAEKSNIEHVIGGSLNLLKLWMGMPVSENIVLTDQLEGIDLTYSMNDINSFSLKNRIEVQQMDFTRRLAELDMKNVASGYIPTVQLNAAWGRTNGNDSFSNLWSNSWFTNSNIGLSVSIPIFDGLRKKFSIQRKRIQIETLDNSYKLLVNNINFQITDAKNGLDVNLRRLEVQKTNMELATEVREVATEKYREGVGSNLEVLNAEKDYKEAETNYLEALFNAIISKVDLDLALGKLHNNND